MKPLLTLTLLTAALPAADGLRFAAEAETSVAKQVSSEIGLELLSGTMRMGDMEMPAPDGFELVIAHSIAMRIDDRYASTGDGRPVRLERSYGEVEAGFRAEVTEETGEEDLVEDDLESELDGEGVAWTWDPDEEDWVATSLDEDRPLADELLDALHFDLDGLGLLPEAEVAEGESWEVDAAALTAILGLGSDLALQPTAGDMADEMVPAVMCASPAFGCESISGELTASYVETIDEGGRFARIELAGELSGEGEPTAMMMAYTDALGGEGAMTEASVETDLELEGELVWNLDEGRVESLVLEGPLDLTLMVGTEENGMSMELELEFEGQARYALVTE